MSLSGAKLLPQNTPPSTNHPPIYVKLTPAALTLLKTGKNEISIELDKSHASLTIGSTKHAGALTAEPGNLEVYSKTQHENDSEFQSLGRVLQRLVLRTQRETPTASSGAQTAAIASATVSASGKKPAVRRRAGPAMRTNSSSGASSGNSSGEAGESPADTSATSTASTTTQPMPESALSPDTLERVVHTLAPGRQTPTHLAKSLDIPLEAAMAAVQACANPVESRGPDEMYALRDRAYCDLRVWEWPYSEEQRSAAIERASKAYGRLGLPSDHSARLRLLKPKPRRVVGDSRSKSAAKQPKVIEKVEKVEKVEKEDETEPKTSEELQKIARKFRETYPEYQKLYTLLSNRRSRPPAQVRRLLNLHRDLESWKKRLWMSAKNEFPADIVMNSR